MAKLGDTTSYRNPWHRPDAPMYGPARYETTARPVEYRGHLIFERIRGTCWDVVKDGACITQRAGINGARSAVDALAAPSGFTTALLTPGSKLRRAMGGE